jgi:Bacterial Ig-like domain (group 3)/Invasin, domain 3
VTVTASGALAATAQAAATAITVSLAPSSIVADGTSTTTATVNVTDGSAGVAGEPVALSSSDPGETIGPITDAGNGTYTATITSSTTIGAPTITATDGTLSNQATLTQTAGPPATVAVALAAASIVADGASTTTATAMVTDAEGHPLAGQAVKFSSSDPGQKIGTVTSSGGTYAATITSSTTVGAPTVTATDGTVSGAATLTQTAGPPASMAVQVSPGAIVADGTSIATATATVTDAQGHRVATDTVSFSSSDPGQFFGPVSNPGDGTYSAQIRSSTRVGTATITATDTEHVSGHASLVQAAGPSEMSLVATPAGVVTNQQVTLFAVVSASSGSPAGTITFKNGSAPIAGCVGRPITASGPTAGCQTSFAASTSPARLTAVFTPGPTSTAPGASGGTTVIVKPDLPAVALTGMGSMEVGQSTIFTATVGAPASRPGPIQPSGTVDFFDNGQPIPSCHSRTLVGGTAACTLAYTAIANHAILARYNGDANFAASTSGARAISVVPVPVRVSGIVNSTMQWLFSFARRSTRILALSVKGASANTTVLVTCHGRGCPFARRKTAPSTTKTKRCGRTGQPKCHHSGTINLAPAFKKPLRVGAAITVLISRPTWIGKYYRFVIKAGRPPRIQINCLAPGATRPGVGCST